MKIAFLCKRRYTGKDVVTDGFGRLHEIPHQLAQLGHEVRGYCLDYHQPGTGRWRHPVAQGSLQWESRSLGASRLPGMMRYPLQLLRELRAFAPDVLFGASDIPHVVLTAWLARRLRLPYAVDLYDNFESFGLARIPGLVSAFRGAVRRAGLVTVVSEPLAQLIVNQYRVQSQVLVVVNAVDEGLFQRIDRAVARERLALPAEARLIGTAGGLSRFKGIVPLYEAWPILEGARADTHLVLAGTIEQRLLPPPGKRVHYLGDLPQARVPELFSALDVGVITLRDDAFGRFCFPQKLQEMLACRLPFVAANVGVMSTMLARTPQLLYKHDDAGSLAKAVLHQLDQPYLPALPVPDWTQQVAGIEPALRRMASA